VDGEGMAVIDARSVRERRMFTLNQDPAFTEIRFSNPDVQDIENSNAPSRLPD
jgi:hypothetical protein